MRNPVAEILDVFSNDIERPGVLLDAANKFVTCMNDPMTGEVYESFDRRHAINDVVFMGYITHEDHGEAPTGDGQSKLFCRVLAMADPNRLKDIYTRLRKENQKPMSGFNWYLVHYD